MSRTGTADSGAPLRGLLPLAGLLVVWQLAGDESSLVAPPPSSWLTMLATLHADGVLLPALGSTLATFALALLAATVVGTLTGIAVGASRWVDRALTPMLDVIATVPGAAVVPLAVLLLGPTRLTGVVIVALAIVWPVLLNTAAATRGIPAVRLDMARSLGLSRRRRSLSVLLRSLTPAIMLGVRVAASMALIATLLFDIFGTGDGIGRLLFERQQRLDAAGAWGLLLIIGCIGYLVSTGLRRLDTWAHRAELGLTARRAAGRRRRGNARPASPARP
jgi:ABC-type nitrate/sulfonate/bicarbonate transport system permease component